jgi:hypothetical protein
VKYYFRYITDRQKIVFTILSAQFESKSFIEMKPTAQLQVHEKSEFSPIPVNGNVSVVNK